MRLENCLAGIAATLLLLTLTSQHLLDSRSAARSVECKNTLRQIGISMYTFADQDPQGRLATGAPDFRRDGSIDAYGWLADYINMDGSSKAPLCAENPASGLATLYDLVEKNVSDGLDGCPPERLDKGAAGSTIFNGTTVGKEASFAGSTAGTPERRALVARAYINQKYNTNYTCSWFLARTAPKFDMKRDGEKESLVTLGTKGKRGLIGRDTTVGELRTRMLDVSRLPSSIVPLLGDGATVGKAKYELAQGANMSNGKPDPFAEPNEKPKTWIEKGAGLVSSQTLGPAQWSEVTRTLELMPQQSPLDRQIDVESKGNPTGTFSEGTYLQDTRNWEAVHGLVGLRSMNMLMADASVRSISDGDGDNLINPGFPVLAGSKPQPGERLYKSNERELDPTRVFSGLFLMDLKRRAVFP